MLKIDRDLTEQELAIVPKVVELIQEADTELATNNIMLAWYRLFLCSGSLNPDPNFVVPAEIKKAVEEQVPEVGLLLRLRDICDDIIKQRPEQDMSEAVFLEGITRRMILQDSKVSNH